MSKFTQVYDGEWVKPNMRKYRIQCCKCGLIHTLNFKVVRVGKRNKIFFRAFRHPLRKPKNKSK